MSPKELKKLADACRKAGIKCYKDSQIEFTLTDEAPVSNYKKKQEPLKDFGSNYAVETDSLTEEQLLMWSVTGTDGASGESL
jgi:hypothetical protein